MDQRNELLTELGVEDIGRVAEEVRAGKQLALELLTFNCSEHRKSKSLGENRARQQYDVESDAQLEPQQRRN